MKRVLVISDLHCGHFAGLTPPDWNDAPQKNSEQRFMLYRARRTYWKFYKDTVDKLKPIDVLIVNGDAVDGKGQRSGSTELLTTDRTEQVDMATACIEVVEAKKVFMSFGTPYHTGVNEDWEAEIAKAVNAEKIGGEDWINVNGLVFNYKHFVGSSSVPYGRMTAIAKERIWQILWNEYGEYPKADVLIRSHVHYFGHCGGYRWLAMTTPALQGVGSKYGKRKMSGTVDFGVVSFDVESKEEWSWESHILKSKSEKRHIIAV